MDIHVRQAGISMIVFGVVGLLGGLFTLLAAGGVNGLMEATYSTGFGVVITGLLLYNLILGLPMILTGLGILKYQNWARILTIVLGALNVLNVPIGSIVGAYALWVMLTPETEPLFLMPPPGSRSTNSRSANRNPAPVQDPAKPARVVPSKADLQS